MSSPVWEIWQNTHRNPAAFRARQQRALAELAQFARQHSPFYRKLYRELPIGIQDIHLLPAVTKADLMAHFDDWVTDPAVTRAGVDAFVADKTLVGQPSRTVLVTNLANRVQPFLRYDLGDSITVHPDPCPCGSLLPAIRVEGRQDEILCFETPDGKGIALLPMALSTVVEETAGVRRFQIIQTTPSTLRIRLEEMPGADEKRVWALVTSRLQEYLAAQGVISVTFERDPERPRPHPVSGKFRHVWTELEASGTALQNVMASA